MSDKKKKVGTEAEDPSLVPDAETLESVEPETEDEAKQASSSEVSEVKDQLLRLAAEFDNYKKRTERDRLNLSAFVTAQTVKALLVPCDNLERALSSDAVGEDYQRGVALTLRQLYEAFEKLGLVSFGERGESFDPELHDAVLHIEDPELGENVISTVLQKGYKLGETVLRHAMVEVAN